MSAPVVPGGEGAGGRVLPTHLAFLRERVRPVVAAGTGVLAFGDARLDGCLPQKGLEKGLALGVLHEVAATGAGAETGVLPAAFAAVLVARLPPASGTRRPVLWVTRCDDLYAPGLLHVGAGGLDPGRLVLVRADDDAAVLGAMETALRAGGLAAVVGEVGGWGRMGGRVATRRLQLACQARGVTAFVLRRWPYGGQGEDREASAASTRWRLAPAPSVRDATGPGPSRWVLELLHARGGRAGSWLVEVRNDGADATTPAFRVVAALADHAAAPAPYPEQAAGYG